MYELLILYYVCKKVYYLKEDVDLVSVFSIVRYIVLINVCVMYIYKGYGDFLMMCLLMVLSMFFVVF